MEKDDLSELLTNIAKTLDVYTIPELNSAIIEVLDKRDGNMVKINKVVDAVCQVFDCSKRTLINTSFRGQNKVRASVLILFLVKEYEITHRFIAKRVFNLEVHGSVSSIIKTYRSPNPKIKTDAEFIEYYNKVKCLVNASA